MYTNTFTILKCITQFIFWVSFDPDINFAVDGDFWYAHPGHEAPVPPHPKYALLG